jgi:hypothetical protein
MVKLSRKLGGYQDVTFLSQGEIGGCFCCICLFILRLGFSGMEREIYTRGLELYCWRKYGMGRWIKSFLMDYSGENSIFAVLFLFIYRWVSFYKRK